MIGQIPKRGKSPFVKRNLKRIQNWAKGLNNKFSPYILDEDELADIQNMNYDEKGTLLQRPGFQARYGANFATGGVRGLTNYRKEDGTSFLVMSADDKIFYERQNFQQLFDIKAEWDTGTLESITSALVPGDIVLEDNAGELGAALLGDASATLGGNFDSRQGIWTSPAIDYSAVTDKTTGVVVEAVTLPGGTSRTIQTRTAAASGMAGASAWAALGLGNTIVSPGNNYIQIRVILTSTNTNNPSVQSLQIQFDTAPAVTTLLSSLDSLARYQFATQNDILFMFNGVNANKKWIGTGAAADQAGSPPIALFAIVHKNRMFLAGNSGNKSRLYFSDLGNPESWPVLNFVDVGKGDGDVITGLAIELDMLVITKNNSTWNLQGDSPTNFVLRLATNEAGSTHGGSFAKLKNALGMMTSTGVQFFDGVKVANASEKIEGSLNGLNKKRLDLARGVYFLNHYYMALPEGSNVTNNVVWVFDVFRAAWTIYRGMNVGEWCVWRKYNQDTLVFGDSTKGMIYNALTGLNDDGVAIDAYFVTKQLFGLEQEIVHLLRLGFVDARETQSLAVSLEVRLRANNGSDSSPIFLSIPISTKLNVRRFIPSQVGVTTPRTVGIKVRNNTLNRAIAVYAVSVEWSPKGMRET